MSAPPRKRSSPQRVAKTDAVLPTRERLARAGSEAEVIIAKGEAPTVIRQSPFDRLVSRNVIDFEQRLAGERLQSLWYISGQEASVSSVDLNRLGGGSSDGKGMPRTEREAAARSDLRDALGLLPERVRKILIAVICEDAEILWVGKHMLGWKDVHQARAAALETLKLGLDLLAIHWGYVKNPKKFA